MGAILSALVTLVGGLVPLIQKAVTAKAEDHAKILSDAQIAIAAFQLELGGFGPTLDKDEADIKAAIDAASSK